jgi:tetratricopeptide (TPR) repeat protein
MLKYCSVGKGASMRASAIAVALLLVGLSASAQTMGDAIERCNGDDPDLVIAGCSQLIQSGQATDLSPVYVNRAGAYIRRGLSDQAIDDYTKAIALRPYEAPPYSGRCIAYLTKHHFDQAIADCSRAIAIRPDYSPAYNNRGGAYESKGDRGRAIADYRMVLKLDPDNRSAAINLKRLGGAP